MTGIGKFSLMGPTTELSIAPTATLLSPSQGTTWTKTETTSPGTLEMTPQVETRSGAKG